MTISSNDTGPHPGDESSRTPSGSGAYESTVAAVEAATSHLIATAERLSDEDIADPSALAGWSRGHVLTHLARNADALRNLLIWAATGEETPMYADENSRDAQIEAGSRRPAEAQLADLREAAETFRNALAGLPMDRRNEIVRLRGGREVPAWEIPAMRLREVEIHHVDLDAGYTPAHWSDEFVAETLAANAERLRDDLDWPALVLHADDTGATYAIGPTGASAPVEVSGQQSALLAWVTGRSSGDGLRHTDVLPTLPAWG